MDIQVKNRTAKYGVVGLDMLEQPILADGMNEKRANCWPVLSLWFRKIL